MNLYYYLESDVNLIRISSRRRPSPTSRSKRGTWLVMELADGRWVMPPFPEITWGSLKLLQYIGHTKGKAN